MVSLRSLRGLPAQIRWPAVLFILGVTLLVPARANCLSDCKDKYDSDKSDCQIRYGGDDELRRCLQDARDAFEKCQRGCS
jgi:hypothetical protein